jgi:hypothetical protein
MSSLASLWHCYYVLSSTKQGTSTWFSTKLDKTTAIENVFLGIFVALLLRTKLTKQESQPGLTLSSIHLNTKLDKTTVIENVFLGIKFVTLSPKFRWAFICPPFILSDLT